MQVAIEGVDYAFAPRPDIAGLAAAGKRFACRYGGPGSLSKQLDAAEAQALGAAGIAVVANAEGSEGGLLGGWSVGVSWARSAQAHFARCGMPAGRPIYLSVDFDVQSGQWAAVADALRGAASIIGASRVGVYGGRRAIQWARRDGVAQWFWQTYAWSGGVWVPGNHIEQYHNGVRLAGADLDLDRALATDYGQWTIGDDDVSWSENLTAGADGKFATFPAKDWLIGTNIAAWKAVDLMAQVLARLGADPEELAAIKAAAEAGATQGVTAGTALLAAAVADALKNELGLTPAEAEAAAERAVRNVLGSLDKPAATQ